MITVHSSRIRPEDRIETKTDKRPPGQVVSFPAPVRGLVTNENMLTQGLDSATVLENFWPTTASITPRGGYSPRVDVGAVVTGLFDYAAGGEFIVTDASKIYTFTATTADDTTLTAAVSGQTSGDWHGVETQNDAGSFFTLVNGADDLQLYDGSSFQAVNSGSSPHSISGSGLSGTDAFSYVANYRQRQWFVEAGTMNAWYLGVNSISGTATKFPLAGVFILGGSLHSISSYSSDSGDGLDDLILFLTTNGEFALYSGDPSGDMSLVGVYEIGVPLARAPFVRIGGDVLVATRAGFVPVSAAIQKDPGQLRSVAVSRPIGPDWEYWQAAQPSGWKLAKWASRNMVIVSIPVEAEAFVYTLNIETGAWAKFTGWDVDAVAVLGDSLHFAKGVDVFEADKGGQDNGSNFICKMCGSFQDFGSPGFKAAKRVRGKFRSSVSFSPQFSIGVDYTPEFPTAPNSTEVASLGTAVWGASEWGEATWGRYEERKTGISAWHVVNGHGFALGVQLQITSSAEARIDCDLVGYDLTFVPGDT